MPHVAQKNVHCKHNSSRSKGHIEHQQDSIKVQFMVSPTANLARSANATYERKLNLCQVWTAPSFSAGGGSQQFAVFPCSNFCCLDRETLVHSTGG